MKFDVYFSGVYPFRILSNVSQDELDAYCYENGYYQTAQHRRSVTYFDVYISKHA